MHATCPTYLMFLWLKMTELLLRTYIQICTLRITWHILWYALLEVLLCYKCKSNVIIYIVKYSAVSFPRCVPETHQSLPASDIIINCIHQVNNLVLVSRGNAPTHGRSWCQSAGAIVWLLTKRHAVTFQSKAFTCHTCWGEERRTWWPSGDVCCRIGKGRGGTLHSNWKTTQVPNMTWCWRNIWTCK